MTIAGTGITVVTSPPDGRFKAANLCPGVYRVAAVADGYRTHDFEEVTVLVGEEASFSARLVARSQKMTADEFTQNPLTIKFDGDADLTHVRYWFGQETPPENARFEPLNVDTRSVDVQLPTEGAQIIYAELATAAAVDDDSSNDLFAYTSPVLDALSFLDSQAPSLQSARHVPSEGARTGFALRREGEDETVATMELVATDDAPSSDLSQVIITPKGIRGRENHLLSDHIGPSLPFHCLTKGGMK